VGVAVASRSVAITVAVYSALGVAVGGTGVKAVVTGDAGAAGRWEVAHPTTRVRIRPVEKSKTLALVNFPDILGPRSHLIMR
jgi:hypothetical protein